MSTKKSYVPFLLIALASVGALFFKLPEATPEALQAVNGADTAWMLVASGLVLLMTPGLSFFYGGMVSYKSVVSTMLQSFISLGVVSVLWVVVGFSLAFGDSIGGVIGNPATFFMFKNVTLGTNAALSPTVPLILFAMFQLKFAIITPALITGSFAERIKFSGYLIFICLFALLIYAPLAHWTWHPDGFLFKWMDKKRCNIGQGLQYKPTFGHFGMRNYQFFRKNNFIFKENDVNIDDSRFERIRFDTCSAYKILNFE